jgi:hypothetical protein
VTSRERFASPRGEFQTVFLTEQRIPPASGHWPPGPGSAWGAADGSPRADRRPVEHVHPAVTRMFGRSHNQYVVPRRSRADPGRAANVGSRDGSCHASAGVRHRHLRPGPSRRGDRLPRPGRAEPDGVGTPSAGPTRIPGVGDRLFRQIPRDSGQAGVVYGEGEDSASSTVVLYAREGPEWRPVTSWPAHNGRNGWTTDITWATSAVPSACSASPTREVCSTTPAPGCRTTRTRPPTRRRTTGTRRTSTSSPMSSPSTTTVSRAPAARRHAPRG